jgi:hypothetical protein
MMGGIIERADCSAGEGVVVVSNWRFWVLAILLFGPPAAYIALGVRFLLEHGWAIYGFVAWTLCAIVFGILSVRWTRTSRPILTPIDLTAPGTFSPRDREAWKIILDEIEKADEVGTSELIEPSVYLSIGQRMAEKLARHYDPKSQNPIDHVPLADLLTALELAAGDLGHMLREVPGGDLVNLGHGKSAVQAASFFSKANEYYNYLLPLFQPVQGIVRLGTHKLMAQPAWRNVQQNALRWFFRAYVHRLGTHLIELYSGRLAIGAETYRRLSQKIARKTNAEVERAIERPLAITLTGADEAGKSTLLRALDEARAQNLEGVRAQLQAAGLEPGFADLLRSANLTEARSYPTRAGRMPALDNWSRSSAVSDAVGADILLLLVDAKREDLAPDVRFLKEWREWFDKNPGLELPPVVVLVTHASMPVTEGEHDASDTPVVRARLLDERIQGVRKAFPSDVVVGVVPVELGQVTTTQLVANLLPQIAILLQQAERGSVIRNLHEYASRSKAGRFMDQVGRRGRRLVEGAAGAVVDRVRGAWPWGKSAAPKAPTSSAKSG